jgi:hypothetical protein
LIICLLPPAVVEGRFAAGRSARARSGCVASPYLRDQFIALAGALVKCGGAREHRR